MLPLFVDGFWMRKGESLYKIERKWDCHHFEILSRSFSPEAGFSSLSLLCSRTLFASEQSINAVLKASSVCFICSSQVKSFADCSSSGRFRERGIERERERERVRCNELERFERKYLGYLTLFFFAVIVINCFRTAVTAFNWERIVFRKETKSMSVCGGIISRIFFPPSSSLPIPPFHHFHESSNTSHSFIALLTCHM